MKGDMTRGSATKQILLFTLPFFIGNLFQQIYSIADMIIVGRTMDPLAYAAVGSTGTLVWFATSSLQSLTIGFSALTARFFGAGDGEKMKKSFADAIRLTAIIGIALSVLCVILARPMLLLLRTPEELLEPAYAYLLPVFGGLIVTAFYNLLANMICALGDSRSPLYFLIAACLLNIVLDVVFIAFCGMGTAGAGLATILAQVLSAVLAFLHILKKQPLLHVRRPHFKWDGGMNRALLRLGLPMTFLSMVLSVGGVTVQFTTNSMGASFVTSQVTGSKIETFLTLPVLSFGSAVSVFAAQNFGARKYRRVLRGARQSILMCCLWCVLAASILIPFGKWIIGLVGGGELGDAVVSGAYTFILANTVFTPILSVLVIFKSILQAVGRTTFSVISGFTEILGRASASLGALFLIGTAVLTEHGGFTVVCFSNPTAWLLGLLTVLPDFILMTKAFRRLPDAEDAVSNL
jgi:putative MATE family efflux protein